MSVEGDIVFVVMVVVVSGGGNEELYCELKCGECLCGERYVQSRVSRRVLPRFGPRSAIHESTRVDGRERLSDAAPTTALAASSRGCVLSPRRASPAVRRCRALNASRGGNFPLRLRRILVWRYYWRSDGC